MKQSASRSEYVIQPPEFPEFLLKTHIRPFEELVEWAKREFQMRLIYCAERGYWRSLKYLNEEYSPYRILAEMHGFRKYCAYLRYNPRWATARGRTQRFIVRAYQLREMLFRQQGIFEI